MNVYKASEKNNFKTIMIAVLLIVLLASSILVGSVLAWLTDEETFNDGNKIKIGSVDFDIYYNDTTLITATKNNADGITPEDLTTATSNEIVLSGTTAIRDPKITIRNTGTVAAIMRATIQIRYELNGVKLPCVIVSRPTAQNEIAVTNTNWIDDFSRYKDSSGNGDANHTGAVATGYTYYNSQIQPYTISSLNASGGVVTQQVTGNAVNIIDQILVPDAYKNATYYISIIVEGVAYSGNIYQEEEEGSTLPTQGVNAYPFGKKEGFPAEWEAWK